MGSRLKQWNLLAGDVRVSMFRDRQKCIFSFSFMEGDLEACNNIDGVIATLNIIHDPDEWRLFAESYVCFIGSWQCFPVGHEVYMKEPVQA